MTKKKTDTLVDELEIEIDNLELAMRQFDNGLVLLQTESNGSLPWTGEEAYNYLKDALAFSDHNKKLLLNLNKCLNYLTTLKEDN